MEQSLNELYTLEGIDHIDWNGRVINLLDPQVIQVFGYPMVEEKDE